MTIWYLQGRQSLLVLDILLVSAIGMKTEFGQIADLTQNLAQEKSPLQKELDHLTKQISVIAVSVGLFFMVAATLFVHQLCLKPLFLHWG